MSRKYTNFVTSSSTTSHENLNQKLLSGKEAAKLYLDEIKEAKDTIVVSSCYKSNNNSKNTRKKASNRLSDRDLFALVQNNDVSILRDVLDTYPNEVNKTDEFGWSLLMIACQANSIESVQALLRNGADTTIEDKAGNTALRLVIKNKNYILAEMLLSHRYKTNDRSKYNTTDALPKLKETIMCMDCNNTFLDKEEHMSSTLHNICASKNKQNKPSYVIPQSNKGFQIMLKGGWDKNRGLGPSGLGKQYPIKSVQKNDKKGLGHKKSKAENIEQKILKHSIKNIMINNFHENRRLEIKFRREFY